MRSYLFIASEVRSGSTFIAESIAYYINRRFNHELWGLAKEPWSHVDATTPASELLDIAHDLYLDRSGFASGKIMCKALSVLHKKALTSPEIKNTFFSENSFWIVVRRKDKLRQAISLATAEKSGVYHFYGDASNADDKEVTIEPVEVERSLKAITLSDLYLETFTRSLPKKQVLSFFYEDFMQDNGKYLNLINELCRFPIDPDALPVMDFAKLTPTGQSGKREAYEKFCQWLLENYD
ncbi:Stf0 family sulfotransferase [Paraburkholderia sp. A2WS-5]|uniref:Stf0 family sulfotransferase n=1 Tax=Paraburkholderia sp. A2WS-5 TaxID=3028372 RepID=UPI003B7B172F